ncbi:MAG: glycosyltransferase family 2 protein, partial [Treponema sp.]|nr:glycosyltransferase family 2 protein [Treponema sp.]
YNGGKFLREQIDSILNQSIQDSIELVVCDDCSTDNTITILEEYAKKNTQIKIFLNKSNLGFKRNFEKAISLCSGDFIALADQDDIWESEKLEKLLKNIGDNDFICSNALLVDSDNVSLGITMKDVVSCRYIPNNLFDIFRRILFQNIVQGSTMLVRSSFIKNLPSIPDDFEYHDWWFAFNSCAKNGFAYLDECTIRYRRHDKTVTKADEKKYLANDLKRAVSTFDEYKKTLDDYDRNIRMLRCVSSMIAFSEEYCDFLEQAIRYYSELKDKTFWSFFFFVRNCKYIYLDKNILRNGLRIAKRFLGLLYWRLYLRRKILGYKH